MEDSKKFALLIVNHLNKVFKSGNLPAESSESVEIGAYCIESAYSLDSKESVHIEPNLEDMVKHYYDNSDEMMDDSTVVLLIIVNHLKTQLYFGNLSENSYESVEIAIQCIESASDFDSLRLHHIEPRLDNVVMQYREHAKKKLREQADEVKKRGNDYMKKEDYENAIIAYTEAITIDPTNAVYYCNRAAGYCAISKYHEAIQDCFTALEHDKNYIKAYGRLNYAFTQLKQMDLARCCFDMKVLLEALEFVPENSSGRRLHIFGSERHQFSGNRHRAPPDSLDQRLERIRSRYNQISLDNILHDDS